MREPGGAHAARPLALDPALLALAGLALLTVPWFLVGPGGARTSWVNDAHGHHTGDALLIGVAGRMAPMIGPDDLAVRLGGDEFAVLLLDAGAARAGRIADRIAGAIAEPIHLAGLPLRVGASVGVATGRANDPDRLMREADAAMYLMKLSRNATASV